MNSETNQANNSVSFVRRPATDDDYESMCLVHHGAYRDVIERQYGNFDEEVQDEYFKTSWDSTKFEIIEVKSESAGYCSIEAHEDSIIVSTIAISPDFQGKGIGTQILNETIAQAQTAKVPVHLKVFKVSDAVELYKRLGFKVIGEEGVQFIMEYPVSEDLG